jgi:hypothetical protein
MPHFVQVDGRFVAPAQVTHVGPVVHEREERGKSAIPPEAQTYLCLTSKLTLYVTWPVEAVIQALEG